MKLAGPFRVSGGSFISPTCVPAGVGFQFSDGWNSGGEKLGANPFPPPAPRRAGSVRKEKKKIVEGD